MKARIIVLAIVLIAVGLAVFAHLRALSAHADNVEKDYVPRGVDRAHDRAANVLIGASRDQGTRPVRAALTG